ncbi:MAG: DUF3142 domain-containing protein [Verrucomicrobiota bacterium]
MNKRVLILSTVLVAAVVALAAMILFARSGRRMSGLLRQEVYVWQRAWSQPVRDAVSQRATNFSALAVLKAEVSWLDKRPQVARVALDYQTFSDVQRPIGIALRIGPYAGPFKADDPIGSFIADLCASLVAEARTNQLQLSELQIDFDCAESKLDGYRVWVEMIQRRLSPLPVTITALPSWLDSRAFQRLATVATNYVLQVHSVERPKSFASPFTLCDPRAASRAVERAGRMGVPFRVALPTYGYLLAFDPAGKFLGLSAEGPRPNWPTNAVIREVSSNPMELAGLVQSWTHSRPAAMRGVIWYRLPTIVDNFNWRWPTLGAMLETRVPREVLRVNSRRVESRLVEISLANEGELDISSRLAVEVRWSKARLMAGDALRDFELADSSTSAARFQTRSQPSRIRAGESLVLGWLRFDQDCEVRCELKKQ